MRLCAITVGCASFAINAAAAASPRVDQVLMQGNPCGRQTVESAGGRGSSDYFFNDRGRGPHIIARWKLDGAGIPTEYSAQGQNYTKAPIEESFHMAHGVAIWSYRTGHGERKASEPMFYVPNDAPPEFTALLARALRRAPGHRLALLPAGEASLNAAESITVNLPGGTRVLTQYRIAGLDFTPVPVWLDQDGRTAAVVSDSLTIAPAQYQPAVSSLVQAQAAADRLWSRQLAAQQTHIPAGDLVIRGARVFDPRDSSVVSGTSVWIRGPRIVKVAPDADIAAPPGAEVIDAAGRFLMPGLWDNHQHFSDNYGVLDIINGVTSARDMANDTDEFPERVARFDAGTEIGPRVFKAGIIDGRGPFAAPTKMLIDSAAEALAAVDWYAAHGYGQIKIYSSVKPEFVPIIADEAHAHGLRVSGHVPAFMSAQQFIEAGADEIQHLNYIVLNFLSDTVQDTRNMTRFTAVAEHAQDFAPDQPRVQRFIAFLKLHHTVLDPTLDVFEEFFSADPGAVVPGLEGIAKRVPPQIRRQLLAHPLVAPKGEEARYRCAFPAMLRLFKALYDAGIPLIPGTDSFAGYTLIHELELYVRAGIPPSDVLRMATLGSAHVIGADYARGVIAPGKLADMILVGGDPTVRISDLHAISLVIKDGRVFYPARLEQALGIGARACAPPGASNSGQGCVERGEE